MFLGKEAIEKEIRDGNIAISPFDEKHIQPASYDVHLSDSFSLPVVNQGAKRIGEHLFTPIKANRVRIEPLGFILGATIEWMYLSTKLCAFVEGRSGTGRSGIVIQNAGWIDPGFKGTITLEIFNMSLNPIELHAGDRIAQFVWARCEGATAYSGSYQGQSLATPSKWRPDV